VEKVDFLIVGQGIAGSILAVKLMDAGYSIKIINEEKQEISSLKAGGIYNPITGRKMVKTWLADELFLNLESFYQELEIKLSARFIYPMPIYRMFGSYEEQNDWSIKISEPGYKQFVEEMKGKSIGLNGVKDEFGGLMLKKCGYVNVPDLLTACRNFFIHKGVYHSEVFEYNELTVGVGINYKNLKADKVIFCEGPEANKNPFWKDLPFRLVKGETLEIITELPEDMIVNKGVFILPKEGRYTVGATYDHNHLDHTPSEKGIKNLEERLRKIYGGEYQFVKAKAGVRPATFDRRPFIGFHREQPAVGVFNGFGSKGVSLIPYFAEQLVNYLRGDGDLMPEVDITRVTK